VRGVAGCWALMAGIAGHYELISKRFNRTGTLSNFSFHPFELFAK
jgi:hypothetical protein